MAQIINHNPEDNPQLNQLYEILLLAGYFRIRIASLKAFDKVIGGLAWCITSSNFEIEVQYSDQMQIGQKIRVSQKICEALQSMKCPYTLQPFQLQGLDVNNIYPVIQWLVKHVYETRFQTMKYNRDLSYLLGKKMLGEYDKGNAHKIPLVEYHRVKVNRAVSSTNLRNPLRIYSALLEFEDKSSLRMYNKLLHLSMRKQNKGTEKENEKTKEKEKEGKKEQQKDDLINLLHEDQKELDEKTQQKGLNDFGTIGKISLQRLERMIQESKNQIQQGIHQQPQQENQQQLQQNLTIPSQVIAERQQIKEDKLLRLYRQENQKYQNQLQAINSQVDSYATLQKQLQDQFQQVQQRYRSINEALQKMLSQKSELDEIQAQIQKQLQQTSLKANSRLESLVQQRIKLKKKKAQIKKKAKGRLQELDRAKEMAIAAIPEIDQEAFNKMLQEADVKKKIYHQKYEQLTTVNQQLAILQRKAQNFTSPAQIAQYHQRFVELFEAINYLIEQKRSMYSQTTNLESTQKIVENYLKILNNTKQSYREAKKKAEKKELAVDLKQILTGMEANMNNSIITLGKLQSQKEQHYGQYLDLIKLEREYLKNLRVLKVQYENAEKFYHQ